MNFFDRLTSRRLKGPEPEPIQIHRKRIYVLPTGQGLAFGFIILIMLLGSINYSNSMGYALTFLLAAIFVVSILHTHRNLLGILVLSGHCKPVFTGETLYFAIRLKTPATSTRREALFVQYEEMTPVFAEVQAHQATTIRIPVNTRNRGRHSLKRFKIFTEFPLGFMHAWCWAQLNQTALAYPKPSTKRLPIPSYNSNSGEHQSEMPGREDFSGLRNYRKGDSPKHIAWKRIPASGFPLTKQFSGSGENEVLLSWDDFPGLGNEERLSQLCAWVLHCHRTNTVWELILPNQTIGPANGEAHYTQCLEALALFNNEYHV